MNYKNILLLSALLTSHIASVFHECAITSFYTFLGYLGIYASGIGVSTYAFHKKTLYNPSSLTPSFSSLTKEQQTFIKNTRLLGLGLIATGSILTFNTVTPAFGNYLKLGLIEGSMIGIAELMRSNAEIQGTFESDPVFTHSIITLVSILLFQSFKDLAAPSSF